MPPAISPCRTSWWTAAPRWGRKMIWKRHLPLEELNATSLNTLVAHLSIVYTRIGDDTLEAEMPVDARTHQPFGLLHGGASAGAGGNPGVDGRFSDDPRRAERAAASGPLHPELGDCGIRRAGAAVLYLPVEYDGAGLAQADQSDRLKHCGLSVVGAFALGYIALNRGEQINALWIVVASVCIYLIAYRFYGRFIAKNVLGVDATRMTPAVRHNDGLDYVPTDKKVLFGHHFAAIARSGPVGGAGAGGANGLPAGDDLDPRGRGAGGRGAGLYGAVRLDPPRRAFAGVGDWSGVPGVRHYLRRLGSGKSDLGAVLRLHRRAADLDAGGLRLCGGGAAGMAAAGSA
ncbi:hypothetical protein L1887_52584 [Cichorium endivia]|nr:hypothetical protein L1887_52584 [Cichorium endivia]